MGHSGLPILMTSITTIAALLSFTLAELSAIAEIGYVAAAGVGLALSYTIVVLPAILAFTPLRSSAAVARGSAGMDRLLIWISQYSTSHPTKIIVISLIASAVFSPFIFQLKFSHNIIKYFPDSMRYPQDLAFIDRNLKGSETPERKRNPGTGPGHRPGKRTLRSRGITPDREFLPAHRTDSAPGHFSRKGVCHYRRS